MTTEPRAPGRQLPLSGRAGTAVAFAIGFVVVPLVGPFAPGPIGALALMAAAGFAAYLIAPGWRGFLACSAGLIAYTAIQAALQDFAGLQFLTLVFLLPALAAGACGGRVVVALRARGLAAGLGEPGVWMSGIAAVLLVLGIFVSYGLLTGTGSPP